MRAHRYVARPGAFKLAIQYSPSLCGSSRASRRQLREVDVVSYHASDRGMFLFGPVVVALSRFAGKPSILRLFGGSFGDAIEINRDSERP